MFSVAVENQSLECLLLYKQSIRIIRKLEGYSIFNSEKVLGIFVQQQQTVIGFNDVKRMGCAIPPGSKNRKNSTKYKPYYVPRLVDTEP